MALSRRFFLVNGATVILTLTLPGLASARVIKSASVLKAAKPQKALVLWYSQTGHTERYGKLIARTWEKQGLTVDTTTLKQANRSRLAVYDLIAIGTPVHYLDIPQNVYDWLAGLPRLDGIGVASFVSFGGKGDGQRNAALGLLEAFVERGGIPLGMGTFGNMSAYPPTWSMGNEARTLKYRDKPDPATFAQVRQLAASVITQSESGRGIEAKSELEFSGLIKGKISREIAKATIGRHEIDEKLCIHCGACVQRCPVGAINLSIPHIDQKRCILCFGCLNNCPTGAHNMTVFGRKIYSFNELLRRHAVTLQEPPELKG